MAYLNFNKFLKEKSGRRQYDNRHVGLTIWQSGKIY